MATLNERTPPSLTAVAIGSALVAGIGGYFLGQASSLGVFGGKQNLSTPPDDEGSDAEEGEQEAELEEAEQQTDLKDFPLSWEECKLVLVVRTDLGMTKGKIAAQCGHATLACYKTLLAANSRVLKQWERFGQAKIAVQIKSEEEMQLLQAQAMSLGICARIIHDAGRTQIANGSATVLGVGPAPKSVVDQVTGHLKLL